MISQQIGKGAQVLLKGIVKALVFVRINPNHLTFLGFVMSILTAYAFSQGRFAAAGVIIIFAGLFDMVDGIVARMTDNETPFGAFFDSVMDRYSDLIMYLGLIIWVWARRSNELCCSGGSGDDGLGTDQLHPRSG